MLKPNNQNSKLESSATQKSPSNTRLFPHIPLTLSTNSFKPSLSLQLHSQISNKNLLVSIDYLRISSNNLTRKKFEEIKHLVFSQVDRRIINQPWHPSPNVPKSKRYQKRIVSKSGITLGFTKKAKNKGKNTRYVYDIMIDLKGSYLADLGLLKQIELINYLNNRFKLKCHRIDIAIDDCFSNIFPVLQIKKACENGNYFGFRKFDASYFQVIDNQFKGTLGLGSRTSTFFVRIYTKGKKLVRWETELKKEKAQLSSIASLNSDVLTNNFKVKELLKTLVIAAIGQIDFRDKQSIDSSKKRTIKATKRLPFWQEFIDSINQRIESQINTKYLTYLFNIY